MAEVDRSRAGRPLTGKVALVTGSLRQEVTGRGVRISLVEPGAVATELPEHITRPEARAAA